MILEQSRLNQLMVLVNVFKGKTKPTEIGKDLGITLQGVIYHLKILKKEGLVSETNELTKKGFDFLYSGLNEIRNFVRENITEMDSALTWEAISDQKIMKGERVSLIMRDGYLHASKHAEPSNGAAGTAQTDALANETVAVSSVTGLISMKLGTLKLVVVPNAEDLLKKSELIQHIKQLKNEENTPLVGVIGEAARFYAVQAGLRIDFEFASLYAAFEAATRGESSMIIVSQRRFHFSLPDIRSLQVKNPEIVLKILHLE
ncbi:MAG: transcriptional regulator [Thermoplasmataceae archaeon]